jgi:hypothetical protein
MRNRNLISWQKTTIGLLIVAIFLAISWVALGVDFEAHIALLSLFSTVIGMLFVQMPEKSFGFSCGHRMKQIRKEVEMQPSEIVELFNLESEAEYSKMEAGRADVPKELILSWCTTFGVNPDWLKHGSSLSVLQRLKPINLIADEYRPKFKSQTVPVWNKKAIPDVIADIFANEPETLYLCINPEDHKDWLLVVEYNEHCWRTWELGWNGAAKYIPFLQEFLKELIAKAEYKLHGEYATTTHMYRLNVGNTYPGNVIRSIHAHQYKNLRERYSNIRHWPEDMLDFNYGSSSKDTYHAWYGEWFVDVQEYFQEAKQTA